MKVRWVKGARMPCLREKNRSKNCSSWVKLQGKLHRIWVCSVGKPQRFWTWELQRLFFRPLGLSTKELVVKFGFFVSSVVPCHVNWTWIWCDRWWACWRVWSPADHCCRWCNSTKTRCRIRLMILVTQSATKKDDLHMRLKFHWIFSRFKFQQDSDGKQPSQIFMGRATRETNSFNRLVSVSS